MSCCLKVHYLESVFREETFLTERRPIMYFLRALISFDNAPVADHLLVWWDTKTEVNNLLTYCVLNSCLSFFGVVLLNVLSTWSVWFYWLTLNPSQQMHFCSCQLPARTRPERVLGKDYVTVEWKRRCKDWF